MIVEVVIAHLLKMPNRGNDYNYTILLARLAAEVGDQAVRDLLDACA